MTESGPPRFVYGGLFVLLAAPSAGFQWFDGLPFSRAHEFAALVLLAAAIFAGCPTRRDTQPVTSGRVHGFLLALGLCLKLALVLSGQYEGFVACANSPIGGPSTRRCEASYENPFGRFDGATRLDSRIAFDAGAWNLSFLNAERHSVPHWVLGNTDWHRRPIDVAWSGWIDPAPGTALLVSYTGDASLRLGQRVEALPARYGEVATVRVPVAAGRQPIEVLYRFDDDSRIGGVDPKGAYATLRIDTVLERSDVRRPLRSSTVTWIGRAMSVTADVVIVALLANVLIGPFMALSGRGVALLALSLLGALAARSLGTTVGLGGGGSHPHRTRSRRPPASSTCSSHMPLGAATPAS